jgi:hypothetical protein
MTVAYKRVIPWEVDGEVYYFSTLPSPVKCGQCGAWARPFVYTLGKRKRTVHGAKSCPGIYHYHDLELAAVSRQAGEAILVGTCDCNVVNFDGWSCSLGTYFTPRYAVPNTVLHDAEQRYYQSGKLAARDNPQYGGGLAYRAHSRYNRFSFRIRGGTV